MTEPEMDSFDYAVDSEDPKALLSVDAERTNHYREEAREIFQNFFKPSLCLLKSHLGNSFVFDCYLLAVGEFDILGAGTQVEIADIYGCERENVRKLVKKFQVQLGVPAMPGQRSNEGRDKMSKTRKEQLK